MYCVKEDLVMGAVTSISLTNDFTHYFSGTGTKQVIDVICKNIRYIKKIKVYIYFLYFLILFS